MREDSLLWLMIGSAAATCFAAIGAKCLRHFSRHDLEEICRRRKEQAYFGEILRRHEDVSLSVEIFSNLASVMTVATWAVWLFSNAIAANGLGWPRFLLDVLLFGVFLSVAKTWLPWAFARLAAEIFLFHTWRIWKLIAFICTPLLWGAKSVDLLFHRMAGRVYEDPSEDTFEEEIRTIVTEGHREGLLEEDAREMIEGVIELGDADVTEIMTPRTEMVMVQADIPWDELLAHVIESAHTRMPVYGENRDDILGVLYSKDLLPELAKSPSTPRKKIRELIRRPLFVPETKRVDDLLELFQQSHLHIALVLDEYGGVAGLVTIEDVLEEIVGEIVDEYDEDLIEEIERIDENTWEVLGKAHVDEINDRTGLELPDDSDFDTIAGFVFTEIGRIPKTGESLLWNESIRLTVLEATRRRIERVRIERLDVATREIA